MDMEKKRYDVPDASCTMSFLNKDSLDLQSRKHELSLTLTPTTPFKNIFDETPTPTRFLNALESEMFQELNSDNPFDATFRKANSSTDGSHSFSMPDSSSLISTLPDSEDLNTPSITLPSEPETPLIFKRHYVRTHLKTVIVPDNHEDNESTDTLPFTPAGSTMEEVTQCELSVEDSNFETLEPNRLATFAAEEQDSVQKPKTIQTPVITSIGNYSIVKSNTGVPTAVVVTRPSANIVRNLAPAPIAVVAEKPTEVKVEQPQAVVQSVCVTPMVQLMIRLPDGQTMPVQFPVMTQPTAPSAVPAQKTVQPATTVEPQVTNPTSMAKMKLKEVLTMNQKVSCISKNTSSNVKPRSKPHIQPLPHEDLLTEFGISPPSSPIPMQRSGGHNGRKRREPSDNPDEKRRRSLERNRAAATRCREKRKMWITALERKADELADTNTQLQHEVTQLRNEVAQLKTMLLAHKDCPVTLQQKGMAYETQKDPYTTVHIVTSTADDLQRVPNCSMVSPLNAEFMEVEIGSAQSSSDASLTSDTSEASFKER